MLRFFLFFLSLKYYAQNIIINITKDYVDSRQMKIDGIFAV